MGGWGHSGPEDASPGTPDELGGFLGVPVREAAQVHGLLHDAQVLIQRKGHVRVAVPVGAPGGKRRRRAFSPTA